MVHELKTWSQYFGAIAVGVKRFEVRVNDRNFQIGDTLRLMEFDPINQSYTGRWLERDVTFVLPGGQFGISADFCVMSLSDYNANQNFPLNIEDFDPKTSKLFVAVSRDGGMGSVLGVKQTRSEADQVCAKWQEIVNRTDVEEWLIGEEAELPQE